MKNKKLRLKIGARKILVFSMLLVICKVGVIRPLFSRFVCLTVLFLFQDKVAEFIEYSGADVGVPFVFFVFGGSYLGQVETD